jgi:MoaA/NifB/PqqE/SkfB family radical SAM enzyme
MLSKSNHMEVSEPLTGAAKRGLMAAAIGPGACSRNREMTSRTHAQASTDSRATVIVPTPGQEPSDAPAFTYRRPARVVASNFVQNVRYALSWRKWRRTGRLVRRTLQGLRGKPMVRQVEIALDYDCNLSCPHCSRSRLIRPGESPLTLDEYRRLHAEFDRMGVVSYAFTGGEPLLIMDRLVDVIRIFEPHRNVIGIQTNALLLDDARAERLRRAGVDMIQASLDEFHTEDAKIVNFSKAERKLSVVRRHGMKMTFTTVVTHDNIRSPMLEEMIRFTREKGTTLFLNIAVPVGSWSGRADIRLDAEDQIELRKLTLRYPHTRLDFAANFAGFGCPAFKERMYVTPYGEVLGCPFLQVSGGSIRKGESIRSIQKRALELRCFDHYHDRCLAGEDAPFLEKYIPLYDGAEQLPLDWDRFAARLGDEPEGRGSEDIRRRS